MSAPRRCLYVLPRETQCTSARAPPLSRSWPLLPKGNFTVLPDLSFPTSRDSMHYVWKTPLHQGHPDSIPPSLLRETFVARSASSRFPIQSFSRLGLPYHRQSSPRSIACPGNGTNPARAATGFHHSHEQRRWCVRMRPSVNKSNLRQTFVRGATNSGRSTRLSLSPMKVATTGIFLHKCDLPQVVSSMLSHAEIELTNAVHYMQGCGNLSHSVKTLP